MLPVNNLVLACAEVILSSAGFWAVHESDHGAGNWLVGLSSLILFGHAMSIAISAI